MFKRVFMLAIATSLATPVAASAAEIQIQSAGPVVELTVTESVASDPDVATVSAGVTTQAPTAVEALRQNNVQMEAVIARIEALGIDEKDIQTSGVNLNPQYDYDQREQRQVFRGYRVSNRVMIKLRDITRTGRALDGLIEAGATDIGGISWSVDDPAPARQQAREAAFAAAREQALGYAELAGYGDVRILEVSEAISTGRPIAYDVPEGALAARNESMPIRPGQVQSGVTVTVKFEMTS